MHVAGMNLFGKSKKPALPNPEPSAPAPSNSSGAISKVRDTIEMLGKREEHLQRQIDKEVKSAKEFAAKQKKREALQCIKRKKLYEKQLEQVTAQKFTLEGQEMQLQSLKINAEALQAQKVAAGTMKREMEAMGGVEAVEETMDDIEEQMADADDIGQALAREVRLPGLDADEDELLAELEGLEAEELANDLGAVDLGAEPASMPSAPISMPSAPTQKVMTEEEKELAELEASMAM